MFPRISEVGPNRKLVPSAPRLSFWTVWFRHNPAAAVSYGTGTPSTIFPCFHIKFRVKSVSFSFQLVFTGSNQSPFIDLQCLCLDKSVSLYRFTIFLQGQIGIPLFDLQGFYRVKPVSFLLFTRFLQGQNSLPLSIYKNFTGSNQSPFFDLQCFYRVNSVSLFFRLTRFLRGPINVLIYMIFTRYLHVLRKTIYGLFTQMIL